MSSIDLKQKLHRQIELIDNHEVLEEVYRILELGSYNQKDNPINKELMASIMKGLEDYRLGRMVSNDQAKSTFEEWLNK